MASTENGWPRPWEVVAILVGCLSIVVFLLAIYVMYGILLSRRSPSAPANDTRTQPSESRISTGSTGSSSQRQQQQQQLRRSSSQRNKKGNPFVFNLYLFFIILPDATTNGFGGFSLIWQGTHDGLLMPAICTVRDSLLFFYFYSNIYLNCFVAREIYTIVLASYQRQKVNPPSIRTCLGQVAISYLVGLIIATWWTLDVNASPFTLYDRRSCDWNAGSPAEEEDPVFNDVTSSLLAFAIVFPPLGYVFWVWFRIWKRNLLPLRGRTRMIALYFCRIVLVFLGFTFPAMMLMTVRTWLNPIEYRTARYWMQMVFFIMIPMQCLVTLRISIENVDYFTPRHQALRQSSAIERSISVSGIQAEDLDGPQADRRMWKAGFFFCSCHRGKAHLSTEPIRTEWDSEDVYQDDREQRQTDVVSSSETGPPVSKDVAGMTDNDP